jgi:lysozyme family protein
MNFSFTALQPGIVQQLDAVKLTKPLTAKKIAETLLPYKQRFQAVTAATGVPVLWLMPIWQRENPSFEAYFGNGDPLHEVTTHVPKGRGPFSTWEAGTIDSLELDHIALIEGWSWMRMVYQWESWNGFGPRGHGRPSGYVWSGTDQYHGGKFVHDGPDGWSPGTWDKQLGCVAIARALAAADQNLEESIADPAVALQESK